MIKILAELLRWAVDGLVSIGSSILSMFGRTGLFKQEVQEFQRARDKLIVNEVKFRGKQWVSTKVFNILRRIPLVRKLVKPKPIEPSPVVKLGAGIISLMREVNWEPLFRQ